jgi:hypothetical protein
MSALLPVDLRFSFSLKIEYLFILGMLIFFLWLFTVYHLPLYSIFVELLCTTFTDKNVLHYI